MSNGAKDANYYIDWLEKSISDEHIIYYEYSDFQNLQKIGRGSYGDVSRANWKENRLYVLKSFNNDKTILKEIVNEVQYNIHIVYNVTNSFFLLKKLKNFINTLCYR